MRWGVNCVQRSTVPIVSIAVGRLPFRFLGAIASLWLATSTVTEARDPKVELVISHWAQPSLALQAAIERWADDIRQDSDGTIVSVIFPAELLGEAFDHYNMALQGNASVALVNPRYHLRHFPIIVAADLPFLYHDAHSGTAAVDAWYRKYAARELREVHYCFAFIHDAGTLHSSKKVVTPEIYKPSAIAGESIRRLGGEKLMNVFLWVMNQDKYDSLSQDQQRVIDHHCTTEWAKRFASSLAEFEIVNADHIKTERNSISIELDGDPLAQWQKVPEPLRMYWAEGVRKAKQDPNVIWDEFQDSLSKHHATYAQSADKVFGSHGGGSIDISMLRKRNP
jgi:TRAP-type transport system periplasmic protein